MEYTRKVMVLEGSALDREQELSIHTGVWFITSVTSFNLSLPSFPHLRNDKGECSTLRRGMVEGITKGESEILVPF